MKKIFFIAGIATLAYACGSADDTKQANSDSAAQKSAAPEAAPTVQDITENPDYLKGIELIAKSDCLTCHKVEEKAVGPAYRDVANKYPADDTTITMLANKVIHGGKGVWGEIPMAPHPAISLEDARAMVKYVLLLKK